MNSLKIKWYDLFFISKVRTVLILLVLCLIVSAYLGWKTPVLISNVSKNFEDNNLFFESLKWLSLNFIAVYFNRVVYQLSVNKYVRVIIQHVRSTSYRRWILTPINKTEKFSQGEVISRIISDTESIRELVTSGTFGIFIDLSFVFSCLFSFINLDKTLGFSTALFELLLTLALVWGSKIMRDVFTKLRNAQAQVNRVTSNVTGGFFQIYFEKHFQYSSKKSDAVFDDFLKRQNQANMMDAFYYAIAESMYPIILAFLALILPIKEAINIALLFALIDLIQRSINPLKEISGKISNIQRAMAGVERVENFQNELELESRDLNLIQVKPIVSLVVDLESFDYGINNERSQFLLGPIKFSAHKGQLIGLIGLSGCGKSTLLNILASNLKSIKDQTYIQAIDDKIKINQFEYARYVSLISQDSHIFSDSLSFNLFFKNDLTSEDFAKIQNINNSIQYMQEKFSDLKMSILPINLSAGEKQLLAGVRSVLLNKPIVLIDEISSAMDSALEKALRDLILLVQKNALTIIVAHRVETIVAADQIFVMEKGRVVHSGNHVDLLTRSATYQQFIEQLSHN